MKTIHAAIEAYYTGWVEQRYTAFLLTELIGPTTTYRYTDAPVPVVWNGFTWSNIWFTTSSFTVDGEGEISGSVTFEDASRTIRTLSLANDLNNFQIKVYEVWADTTNTVFGQDLIIHGVCDGVTCDGEESEYPMATMALRGLFASSAVSIGPTQEYSRNCPYHEFKGPECKYAGAGTFCDRTFAQCTTYANTINFGGFRFALKEDTTITWGPMTGKTYKRPSKPYEPPPPPSGGSTPVTPTGRRRAARH